MCRNDIEIILILMVTTYVVIYYNNIDIFMQKLL